LFDSVSVGASLDDSGARGEYIRKGQDWAETEASRRRMMEVCPRVDFYVSSTVSLYNVWHVSDFHRDWTDKGLVRAQDWNINLCQSPDRDRADVLPQIYKDEIIAKIEKHLEWLEPLDTISRATGGYRGIINFLKQQDNTQHLGTFFKDNDLIDNVREEKFEEVFPEYKDLRSYVR
jgi:hypothetical protein